MSDVTYATFPKIHKLYLSSKVLFSPDLFSMYKLVRVSERNLKNALIICGIIKCRDYNMIKQNGTLPIFHVVIPMYKL